MFNRHLIEDRHCSTQHLIHSTCIDQFFSSQLFSECVCSSNGDQTSEEVEAMSFDQRISSLVASVTERTCGHVTRAIRPTHKQAFLSTLAAAVQYGGGFLTLRLWRAITTKADLVGIVLHYFL